MPAGRPTDYNEETLKLAQAYLDSCKPTYVVKKRPAIRQFKSIIPVDTGREDKKGNPIFKEETYYEDKVVEEEYVELEEKVPTRGGLAYYLNVSRDTLYEWSRVHPEFSDIMERLGTEQEDRLINNGLTGKYNSVIAKVVLTKHGYREGIDATTNDKDIVTDPETKALIDRALDAYLPKPEVIETGIIGPLEDIEGYSIGLDTAIETLNEHTEPNTTTDSPTDTGGSDPVEVKDTV